jgi:hypothetical protein
MTGPNFYTIDFDREIVLQGRSTTFLTIARNDSVLSQLDNLYVMVMPYTRTFESVASMIAVGVTSTTGTAGSGVLNNVEVYPQGTIQIPNANQLSFNNIGETTDSLYVKNSQEFMPYGPTAIGNVQVENVVSHPNVTGSYYTIDLNSNTGTYDPVLSVGATSAIHIGNWNDEGKHHWKLNGKSIAEYETIAYNVPPSTINAPTAQVNVFDGSTLSFTGGYMEGSGYVGRSNQGWTILTYDPDVPNSSVTYRIDYDGSADSHMKFNLIIWQKSLPIMTAWDSPLKTPAVGTGPSSSVYYVNPDYGAKSGTGGNSYSNYLDYQEVHMFGYTPSNVRTSRETWQNDYLSEIKLYDDRSSYSLLKTNPKISGNVKITLDANGEIWLNSIDANNELADSSYKKFPISSKSTYAYDLYKFFKNGQTPSSIIFSLFQTDDLYENTKRTLAEQYDNFYNYGVEQLKNRYYDEDFSFFAPIWLRKIVPDFFIIFRLDHPLSIESYSATATNPKIFNEFFKDARIVKTFDMRETSKLGSYLRKIVNDPRFRERPLDISFDNDIATTWNGVSYADGSMTGRGEFLYDYWREDRPIIELEEYLTGGYERNGIISSNLINLEFLFNDEEATPYSINRYFGLYVTENQLANFEIEPSVLGKITGQTPPPKPGVDGQPYSTKPFIQTNQSGIEIPVDYYHNPPLTNNNTNVPTYQGFVEGKLPLPEFVEDPLRIFYIKDREDVFKRINQLKEVSYGNPGTDDYKRVTQLRLFDTQEDISKYAGVNQITSQFNAKLLDEGRSQLRLHISKLDEDPVFADYEELELTVNQYNYDDRTHDYYLKVVDVQQQSITFLVFKDQYTEKLVSGFTVPAVGSSITSFSVQDYKKFNVGQIIYITSAGYFKITNVYNTNQIDFVNYGALDNAAAGTVIASDELISLGGPTYTSTYNYTPLTFDLSIDTLLTVTLKGVPVTTYYSTSDSYRISIKSTEIYVKDIDPGTASSELNAKLSPSYQQFRWKMTANPAGLRAGQAWAYPIDDPNGYDYVTTFSNEGTSEDVAKALASAINSFENRPCDAVVYEDIIYLRSRIAGVGGNQVQFARKTIAGKSNVYNLGFYEAGNVDVTREISTYVVTGVTTYSTPVEFITTSGSIGTTYDYLQFWKTPSGTSVQIRKNVDSTSLLSAQNSGTDVYNVIAGAGNLFMDPSIPFSVDITNLPYYSTEIVIVKMEISPEVIKQLFVGAETRLRNRARVNYADSERYFSDRRIKRIGDITNNSKIISGIVTSDIFVGSLVTGDGIPDKTYVTFIDPVSSKITLSNSATLTKIDASLTVSELSIINTSLIRDQWYQAQKGLYSPLKGWDVQGKYVYSLPYLEEPVYNTKNNISDFTNLGEYSIIQLENSNQEFYQKTDKRIVAYNVYRPIIGMFSVFPIKEFDFDFYFSDYSYTPILEAFRYYFNEQISLGESIVLASDENYKIQFLNTVGQSANGKYLITIEGYNKVTKEWNKLEEITGGNYSSSYPSNEILLNTYYPFYVYDKEENPITQVDINTWVYGTTPDPYGYHPEGSGLRNYMKRKISYLDDSGNLIEVEPPFYRITINSSSSVTGSGTILPASTVIKITKNDYGNDKDLKSFSGFSAISDIFSPADAEEVRGLLNDEKYVEAFLRQALRSEYDRLRENFNKDYALRSKVVPYINKWVQEGTDARDNYYRLNNSRAFGISNFSPDSSVSFAEPSLLTNEFPYLDVVPKDYPDESLEGSRSYMFSKLSDTAKSGKSWYDLLSGNIEDDWFTKYFAIGYPTELASVGEKVTKSRDERYTFLSYNDGIKRSQTLFRGAKIQVLDVNNQIIPPVEILNSKKYDNYKFSAIARLEPTTPYEAEKPVDIQIFRNDKHRSIVMVITVHVQDYRVQSGLYDYLFFYAVNDQLKNYNQQQIAISNTVSSSIATTNSLSITDFLPYGTTSVSVNSYTDWATMRIRQGFLGSGYLELGDTKLGGLAIEGSSPSTTKPSFAGAAPNRILKLSWKNAEPTYTFSVIDEIIPTIDRYTEKNNTYINGFLNVQPKSFTTDGSIFKFINTGKNGLAIRIVDRTDSRSVIDQFLPLQTTFGSTNKPMISIVNPGIVNDILQFSVKRTGAISPVIDLETHNIKGGTSAYAYIKNLLTYASISSLINTDNSFVKYYVVDEIAEDPTKINSPYTPSESSYLLRFIASDQIIKSGSLAYIDDTDKPIEYLTSPLIGYDIVNTNQNEVIFRHRGAYEPKSIDILSFWVRESKEFTNHYNKDYLLFNTRFNADSPLAGLIRNYGINKVSDAEILKITRGSAYKSVYPLVGEISIDKKDLFILKSTWDRNYYRKYYDTLNWNDLNGIEEMKEFKSFFGSKTMNVPKSQNLQTFLDTEVNFEVISPAKVVGVPQLSNNNFALTDVEGNTKPILTINIDIRARLLRKLYEDLDLLTSFDEFNWLTTLNISDFSTLTPTDVERLKKEYLEKNILQLYQINEVKLYAVSKEGVPILDFTINDDERIAGGYRLDKDCQVVNTDELAVRITKILDTKKPFGYSISVTIKRI